jgi:hypothetical protein
MRVEVDALDRRVATTVAASIRKFRTRGTGSQVGQDFEQLVFRDLLDAHDWRYATGPDQFSMGLQLASRTGTAYEFDGVFGTDTTLYVIEAKHLARGSLTREHIGIFLQKLLDTLLGSYYDLTRFAIKPVVVSAQPAIDGAAYRCAIAWGILLVGPERPTPYELLDVAENGHLPNRAAQRLMRDCPPLATRLWRAFLPRADDGGQVRLVVDAQYVYGADQVAGILDFWGECEQVASRP